MNWGRTTLPYRLFVRHLSEIRYCQDNGTPFHHCTSLYSFLCGCTSYPVHFQKSTRERRLRYMTLKMWSNFGIEKIWIIVRQPVKTFLLEFSSVLSYSMEAVVHSLLFIWGTDFLALFFDFSAGWLTLRFCFFLLLTHFFLFYFSALVYHCTESEVFRWGIRILMTSATELGRLHTESAANSSKWC